MVYKVRKVGAANTKEFRLFLEKDGNPVSFFHDIPLKPDSSKDNENIYNMVVEIPRWTNPKVEIDTKSALNPIKIDIKNDEPRFVKNRFPHKGYIWNYGAFPQTWEDPNHIHPDTGAKGDNDPVDVCEIGSQLGYPGQVKQVKLLGTLALLDEGETDWKMLAIDVTDPLASKLNDINDIQSHYPGLLEATVDWFKYYKVPDKKPANQFAFQGQAKDLAYAKQVVDLTHKHWTQLIKSKNPTNNLSTRNSTLKSTPFFSPDVKDIPNAQPKPDAPIPEEVNHWYFLPSKI